jgi:SAM-dependent methyltransferase
MEFTGERYVPGAAGFEDLYIEHMSRYEFVRGLVPGMQVLDVGSGCGYGAYHLAAAGAHSVLGIDISNEAVEYARRNYAHPGLYFDVMDAAQLDIGRRFDIITCFELIEHVADDEAVLDGVSRVLDEAGVFVVSTPNKATYAAGGEDGKNPFHVREYRRDEFESMLRHAFPDVRILGQHWLEGMAFSPHPDLAVRADACSGCLPSDREACGGPVGSGEAGRAWVMTAEPPYFIGMCAKRASLDETVARLIPVTVYSRSPRYDALKHAAARLEDEFDRRGRWAQGLDCECRVKDDTIRDLQRDVARVRQDLNERGRWAERLNAELRQSGALVQRLAEENRQLREALSAARPGCRSGVPR